MFATASGVPVRVLLRDAYTLPRRWLAGEDLTAFVDETHELGFTGVRVFLQHTFMDWPEVRPFALPLDQVEGLVDWLHEQGLYVELTILADTQDTYWDADGRPHPNPLRMTLTQEIDRVRGVLDRVRGKPNVVGAEVKNEPFANGGRVWQIVDALRLPRPGDVPIASGDYDIIGHEASFRFLDYVTNHIQRKPSLPSEAGKDGHYIYGGWPPDDHSPGFRGTKPASVAEDEPEKYRQDGGPSCDDAEDTAAGFALSAAWFTFHTETGIFAQPFSPRERTCAKRWIAAATFFPPHAPTCTYAHDGLPLHGLEPTTAAGEVVSRTCGNTQYVVAAQPNAQWVPVVKPGFRIVKQGGHAGNLLWLEK